MGSSKTIRYAHGIIKSNYVHGVIKKNFAHGIIRRDYAYGIIKNNYAYGIIKNIANIANPQRCLKAIGTNPTRPPKLLTIFFRVIRKNGYSREHQTTQHGYQYKK